MMAIDKGHAGDPSLNDHHVSPSLQGRTHFDGIYPSGVEVKVDVRQARTELLLRCNASDAGKKVADLCREYGVSKPTFYHWKAKYSGLDVKTLK